MKIVSISWVRNEADVIEAFVRHHCRFLDRMIIIDHRSTDNTPDLLQQLKNEGLPLDLRTNDALAHLQGEALTALLSELKSAPPDFVMPLDADEFLWTNNDKNIRTELEHLRKDIPSLIRWHTYIPIPNDDLSEDNVLRRIGHRKASEAPQWCKVMIPGTLLRKKVNIQMGSHVLVDTDSDRNTEHANTDTLFLAHFPVRSAEQIAGKVFGGWLNQLANPLRARGAIFQWKAIFDELKFGKEIDARTLMRLALDYGTQKQWDALPAEERGTNTLLHFLTETSDTNAPEEAVVLDPVPATFTLKYKAKRLPPLQILAESAETLARAVASLQSQLDHQP